MPNELRFSTPVVPPAVTRAHVREARRINDTTKTLNLEIEFRTDAGALLDNTIEIQISNEGCTKVSINGEPTSVSGIFKVETVLIPSAFEQLLGAYYAGQNTGVLHKLQQLGLLPPGVAS